jgi:hypothetical protein
VRVKPEPYCGVAHVIETPATFMGFAAAAFLLASFAPAVLESDSAMQPAMVQTSTAIAGKGDQIAARTPRAQIPVATVDVVGVTHTAVILRDGAGRVLYRSDPVTNTTVIARDTEMPLVTVKQNLQSPTVQQPVEEQRSRDRPGLRERKGPPVGCEAVVSALVDRAANRPLGLCLALRESRARVWL